MKKVALVACVKSKRGRPTEAKRLYDSTWFIKARAYAESRSDTWRILSAKHGALSPDEVIEPYDRSLHDLPEEARREWAAGVLGTLKELLSPSDEVIILAGRTYREHLMEPLKQIVTDVSIPMKGLGIGKQLRFLNDRIDQ